MRVLKFGGSSLADADRFLRVSDIVVNTQKQAQVALVLSAPAKVTNHLVALVDQTSRGLDATTTLGEIEAIFTRLIAGLKAKHPALDDAKLLARMHDEFEVVRRKIREKTLELSFDAHEPHGRLEPQRRLEQAVDGELGNGVDDTDRKGARTGRRFARDDFDEFLPHAEDLLGILLNQPADVGQDDVAP